MEANNPIRSGEKRSNLLRRIHNEFRFTILSISPHYLLEVEAKAMNDTVKENGFVLARLIFGKIPQLSILVYSQPQQKEWMRVLRTAQVGIHSATAERRITDA